MAPRTTPTGVDRPRGAPSSKLECELSRGSRTFDALHGKADRARLGWIIHRLKGAKHVAAATPAQAAVHSFEHCSGRACRQRRAGLAGPPPDPSSVAPTRLLRPILDAGLARLLPDAACHPPQLSDYGSSAVSV